MADYIAAKNAAAARPTAGRAEPGAATPPPAAGVTLFTQVAANNEAQTTGGNQFPPDGDIATSRDWMVQVVNDLVTMYNWNDNSFKQVNFNTFFNRSPSFFFFAPRVIHDPYWDRFVVLAAACNPCSGSFIEGDLFIAVSQTGDPSGKWWQSGAAELDFLDFPQLGMDLDAIIVTVNMFKNNVFSESQLLTFDKAHLYNGLGDSGGQSFFSGGTCTMAPPYVLDRNPVDYVLQFCPGDTKVSIGSLTNSSRNDRRDADATATLRCVCRGIGPG